MTTTVKALMTDVAPQPGTVPIHSPTKLTVVGAGSVGTAIAFTLLAQRICTDLVLIDKDEALARGETLDILHATMYLDSPKIICSSNYEHAKDSKICIITAGHRPLRASQKTEAVKNNTEIYREIIPFICKAAPNCILLICSYPVDVMTYVAYKLSNFPSNKVFGSGTILESARFKVLVSQRLNVNPSSTQAFVIGEQGKHSIPVWSAVSLAGIRLRDVNPILGTAEDPEDWRDIHDEVVRSAEEVVRLKSCGSWGLALSIGKIVHAILWDSKECVPLSTYIKGCRHGSDKDVFLSLPCILGTNGIHSIVRLNLSEDERRQIQKSADKLHEIQKRFFLGSSGPYASGGTEIQLCAEGEECSIPQH